MKARAENHYIPAKSFNARNRKQDIKALINSMKSKITHNIGQTEACRTDYIHLTYQF